VRPTVLASDTEEGAALLLVERESKRQWDGARLPDRTDAQEAMRWRPENDARVDLEGDTPSA